MSHSLQGVAFLDTLHSVWTHRDYPIGKFDVEMTEWLTLLLQLVDITVSDSATHLKKFLYGRTGVVKLYRQHIKRYVSSGS